MRVPDVPHPLPEPRVHEWPARLPIVRCHKAKWGATEFNPETTPARFRPVRGPHGVVPTIYGADRNEGALSESVFHDVPVRGPGRRIQRKKLIHTILSTIVPTRALRLVELHGAGLHRLGVTHGELIESSVRQYPRTAAWGQALHDFDPTYDGLVWRSRQFNDSLALTLWSDRVSRLDDLDFDPDHAPVPLYGGDGFEMVQQLANDFGITVVH